jgi:transposase-like protein
MKIHEFIECFPTEEACKTHFRKIREEIGIECKKCGHCQHYWLSKKWQWECKSCHFRTTLKSGTALQHAHLSFRKWYLCITLMVGTKKSISAKEMQRQLSHSRYRTIWFMMQKIRMAMGKDEMERFCGSFIKNHEFPLPQMDYNGFQTEEIRIKLLPTKKSHVSADLPGIYRIKEDIYFTDSKTVLNFLQKNSTFMKRYQGHTTLNAVNSKWAKILSSNFTKSLIGIHHRVSLFYLQNYLDQFSYRFNRRKLTEEVFSATIKTIALRPLWYG